MSRKNKHTEKLSEKKILANRMLGTVNKLKNASTYYNSITNLLHFMLEFELGFETAITNFEAGLEGTTIQWMDKFNLESLKKKFSDLLLLDGMIHICGLPSYRDNILTTSIDNIFGPKEGKKDKDKITDLLNLLTKMTNNRSIE